VDDAAERHGADAEAHRRRLLTTVVVGSTGQLGSDLVEAFAAGVDGACTEARDHVHGLAHEDMDIGDDAAVRRVLAELRPDVVVNTAAFHNVPKCETEVERAYALNAVAPRRLARVCKELGARLVHVSTDYVFDGDKQTPYVETDRAMPLNVYGVSKLAGEHEVLSADGNHQVVRSSGLYGIRPCRAKGGNFIDTMYRVAAQQPEVRVVNDEVLTPTFTADLAAQIRLLALEGRPGLFHATNQGSCSWYEFARAIFDLGAITTPLRPSSVRDMAAAVRRPFYSVLENAALAAAGLDRMRHWRAALDDYMTRRAARADASAR
jgi:dTDP-4-dehydrorhamnose reductase